MTTAQDGPESEVRGPQSFDVLLLFGKAVLNPALFALAPSPQA